MSLNDPSDEELMQRVQAGDDASFRVLFERHQRAVYGFLLRRTQQPQTAADLFQDTWLKVHRGRGSYRPDQRFRPWLFGIAANAGRDQLRKDSRSVDVREVESMDQLESLTPPARPESRLTLEAAIAALPGPLREAFLLGAVYGFDHQELSQQLDISPDNARARVSRARGLLREWLGGEA